MQSKLPLTVTCLCDLWHLWIFTLYITSAQGGQGYLFFFFLTTKWPAAAKEIRTESQLKHLQERLWSLFIAISPHVQSSSVVPHQSILFTFGPHPPGVGEQYGCLTAHMKNNKARWTLDGSGVTRCSLSLVQTLAWANEDALPIRKLIKHRQLILKHS